MGPGPCLIKKKNLPGRGLTKVEEHWYRETNFTSVLRRVSGVGIAQSVQGLATGWMVRKSNPVAGRDFPQASSLLYNGHRVFPGLKRPGRGADHPTPLALRLKEE